jgi:hypothetical protein
MPQHQLDDRRQGPLPVVARLMRVDRRRIQQFSGRIHDRHFAAGAETGIETEHGLRPGGRR